jgi:hypothetical protein
MPATVTFRNLGDNTFEIVATWPAPEDETQESVTWIASNAAWEYAGLQDSGSGGGGGSVVSQGILQALQLDAVFGLTGLPVEGGSLTYKWLKSKSEWKFVKPTEKKHDIRIGT